MVDCGLSERLKLLGGGIQGLMGGVQKDLEKQSKLPTGSWDAHDSRILIPTNQLIY